MITLNYWTRNLHVKKVTSEPTTGKYSRLTEEGDNKKHLTQFRLLPTTDFKLFLETDFSERQLETECSKHGFYRLTPKIILHFFKA
jgi:hypothetical protein